jgi:hypothetical protein
LEKEERCASEAWLKEMREKEEREIAESLEL